MRLNFVFGIALAALVSFALCACDRFYFEKRKIRKNGEEVIAKIESFRKKEGRLPEDLAEIGVEVSESGPIFYQKKSAFEYEIWGAIGFDNSFAYNSQTEKWELRP